jgi:hypothetical protein
MCSSSDSSSEESSTDEEDCTMEELERKRLHPYRLHPEMWYNDSGEVCFRSLFTQPQQDIFLCYLHGNKMQIGQVDAAINGSRRYALNTTMVLSFTEESFI